jgi:hypothetical protein
MESMSFLSILFISRHLLAPRVSNLLKLLSIALLMCLPPSAVRAQYGIHNVDFGVGGAQRYSASMPTSMSSAFDGLSFNTGVTANLRYHPSTWVGVQIAYERIKTADTDTVSPPPASHIQEAMASYLVHSHRYGVQPFFALGGAALKLGSTSSANYGIQPAGLLDVGVDLPFPDYHFGLTLQARSLCYQIPITASADKNGDWTVTAEPALTAYIRF